MTNTTAAAQLSKYMDFFHVVSPSTLQYTSAIGVGVQLIVLLLLSVFAGVALQTLPSWWVRWGKPKGASHSSWPARATTVAKSSPATKVVPQPPCRADPQPPSKTEPQPPNKADQTLDDVLDAFFDDEDVLDEALIDAAVPPSAAAAVKQQDDSEKNRSGNADRALAARMTRHLQSTSQASAKGRPEAAGPAPGVTDQLDAVLDAYMKEDELLEEAILDSAVAAARRS